MTVCLTEEEKAELGLIVRGLHDLLIGLSIPPKCIPPIYELVHQLISTALTRAKPNRRMAYLEQWRHFLCFLPEFISRTPEIERIQIATKAIKDFQIEDRRGKKKPFETMPKDANCILLKNGDPWYCQVPEGSLYESPQSEKPTKTQIGKLKSGRVHSETHPSSNIHTTEIKYLQPLNQPRVLSKEYNHILPIISSCNDIYNEEFWHLNFPDIPFAKINRWLVSGPLHSEIALRVAACRINLNPPYQSISRLRLLLAHSS